MKIVKSVAVFFLYALVTFTAMAQQPARTIKIVTFIKHDYSSSTPSPLDFLKMLYGGCKLAKEMENKPVAPFPEGLTDGDLLKSFGVRTINIYQGNAQAEFSVMSTFAADVETNCAIIRHNEYQANVTIDCVKSWQGSNEGENALGIQVDSGKSACVGSGSDTVEGMKKFLAEAKRITLENGVNCLDRIINGQPALRIGTLNTCLYEKMPYYMGNPRRPVVLRSGSRVLSNLEYQRYTIEELSDGENSIPVERFTKAAVDAWIRQPKIERLQ